MHLVATLIANPARVVLSTDIATAASGAIGGNKPLWLAEGIACDIAIETSPAIPPSSIKKSLLQHFAGMPVDVVVQNAKGRRKKVLIADMDSTMIEQECIDELAERAGIRDKMETFTARAMRGEVEFDTSLRQRMALLAGLKTEVIDEVLTNQITLAPGAETLVKTMKSNGAWCALVSGGFTAFTEKIADRLGFDEHRANVLLTNNGTLTGKVAEPILGQQAKVDALNEIAATRALSPADFIAVGDGANDLAMLKAAGTGVALHAKPVVAKQAEFRIDHGDLTALLYIQGYKISGFVV